MEFRPPLTPAILIKRYKRFLADVMTEKGPLTVHCPNTGAMHGLVTSGTPVWLSQSKSPSRKHAHTWEMAEVATDTGPILVGTNTQIPNRLIWNALRDHKIPELRSYSQIKPEVKYGTHSRIDFLLTAPHTPPCWVEVKNVHMNIRGTACFPDSITQRGARHMEELEKMTQHGCQAVIIYVVQRNDCHSVGLASSIDPAYAAAAAQAFSHGVRPLAFSCVLSPQGIHLGTALPFWGHVV